MSQDPHFKREQEKYENPVASREYLLKILNESSEALSFIEICNVVSAEDEESRIGIQRRLRAMEREGQVAFNRDKKYEVQEQSELIQGRVIGHRDGFGFLKHSDTEKDLFISAGQMQTLLHNDVVEGVMAGSDRRGRKEFKVNRVVKPREDAIVGRFFVEQGVATVIPDDNRINHEIMVPKDQSKGARQGHVVVLEITQRPRRRVNAIGKVTEVLGEHMAPGMEIDMALRTFDIPHIWPKAVEKQVAPFTEHVPEEAKRGRVDLRELPLVTIDGEDARDFDDAVYCQRNKDDTWQLWVAIADVSHYVKVGTALDDEAQNRATSVYFPEQVIPMLPEVLSNGLCSLNPEVDRLCMVCEMTIDQQGQLVEHQFYEAVMSSHARLTYNKVWSILQGNEDLAQRYAEQVPDLKNLNLLYKILSSARNRRGAIEFETQETRFVFNAQRKIENIVPLIRNDAHKIIEECMIMANVCAATTLQKANAEGLYRVHDKPDEDRLSTFIAYLAETGVTMKKSSEYTPADFTKILSKLKNRPDKELIQTMLLRCMKQAVYDCNNVGHFGLALDAYAHFTSPIRRYPDLVVHRALKAVVDKQNKRKSKSGGKAYTVDEVEALGEQCSMAERRADDATRDVSDWLKCEFMLDHVGDVFEGVIASVTNFGLFVRLTEYHIDGLVHITSLGSDYYQFDEKRQTLVGEKMGLTFRLGDSVYAKVASVNLDERKIDLTLEMKGLLDKKGDAAVRKIKSKGKSKSKGKASTSIGKTPSVSANKISKTKPVGRKKAGPSTRKRPTTTKKRK